MKSYLAVRSYLAAISIVAAIIISSQLPNLWTAVKIWNVFNGKLVLAVTLTVLDLFCISYVLYEISRLLRLGRKDSIEVIHTPDEKKMGILVLNHHVPDLDPDLLLGYLLAEGASPTARVLRWELGLDGQDETHVTVWYSE